MIAMKLKIQINPEDERRLLRKLGNLDEYIIRSVDKVLLEESQAVAEEMKKEVPVRTGQLKSNIFGGKLSNGDIVIESEAEASNGYNYAPIIENYGGRYSKGIFYFTNGVKRFRRRVKDRILKGINNILRSSSGSTRQRGKVRTFTPRK